MIKFMVNPHVFSISMDINLLNKIFLYKNIKIIYLEFKVNSKYALYVKIESNSYP